MRIRIIAIAAGAALLLSHVSGTAQTNTSETYRQLNLFGDVFERVRSDYVEKVTDEKLIEYAINGMLSSLDPHSSYLTPKNFRDMQTTTRGEFGGLGIEVTMENGFVKVISPIEDTPAFRAGVKAGDLITHLDGEAVQGLTLNDAVERMRGLINTDLVIKVRRKGREPFDITIKRAKIKIRSVRWRAEGDVGYIRVTSFNEQSGKDTDRAVAKLRERLGDKLKGFVLDLRNNPGGLLNQAVKVSDVFLPRGEIVSTRSRRTDDAQRFNVQTGDKTNGLPMVVLINGGSASASEIVAGALQDQRRAIIMGTRSFGKGSVQTIIPLAGHGAIRLTTSRYYTPSGRSIQAKGIEPDIEVKQVRLEEVDRPGRRREENLRGALDRKGETPPDKPKEAPKSNDKDKGAKDKKDKFKDYQLTRALDLLRGLSIYRSTPRG